MSNITQCHQPLPVGASGSYTVIAKLFVPAGALCHESDGEMLRPLHPKLLNTCSSDITPLCFTSVLTSVNGPAAMADEANSTKASDRKLAFMAAAPTCRPAPASSRERARRARGDRSSTCSPRHC